MPHRHQKNTTKGNPVKDEDRSGGRILGSLRTVNGTGIVRVEERFDTDINNMWSLLTEPGRLDRWLGEFQGELRIGGAFRARFHASKWQSTGHVEV